MFAASIHIIINLRSWLQLLNKIELDVIRTRNGWMSSAISVKLHVLILMSSCSPVPFILSLQRLLPKVWPNFFRPASLLTCTIVIHMVLDLNQALLVEATARTLPNSRYNYPRRPCLLYGCADSLQIDLDFAIALVALIVRDEPGYLTCNVSRWS